MARSTVIAGLVAIALTACASSPAEEAPERAGDIILGSEGDNTLGSGTNDDELQQ